MVAINVSQFLPMIVQITQTCPRTAGDWRKASDRLGCQFNSPDVKNRYHCMPDQYRSSLLEFCYYASRSLVQIGNCLELSNSGSINFVKCKEAFSYGCPTEHYYSDGIYNYSACVEINTQQKCFVAQIGCEKTISKEIVTTTLKNNISKDHVGNFVGFILFGIVLFALIVVFIRSKRKGIVNFVRSHLGQRQHERDQTNETSHECTGLLTTPDTPDQTNETSHESTGLLTAPDTPDKSQGLVSSKKESCVSLERTSIKDNSENLGDGAKEENKQITKVRSQGLLSPSKTSCASFDTASGKDDDTVINSPNMSECQEARREVGTMDLEVPKNYMDESEKIVAAVDFGTTYSGYSFSSEKDYQKDPLKITSHSWGFTWQKVYSLKTPTTILLDKGGEFKSFGYDAEWDYAEMDEGEHENFYYFQRFKMALTEQVCKKGCDIKIKDVTGKEMPCSFVIGKGIIYLKDELLHQTNRRTLDNIYWVFTCPSLWTLEKQKVLKDAAVQAGIPEENLVITEEASAVSYHLHHLPCYRQEGSNNMTFFIPERKYLLLDAGGGTVDITVNQVQLDRKSKVLTKCSGPYGGTTVDKAFEKALNEIVGDKLMTEYIQKYPADYIEMMRNYEAVKRKNLTNQVGSVLLRVPITLTQMFENTHNQKIAEKIQKSDYAGKVAWEDDKFRMTKTFFISLFQCAFQGIADLIRKILDRDEAEGTDIILLVGGFSESSQLQQFILDEFMQMEVIVLPEPGLAVLRGAVLYGHQPVVFSRWHKA